MGARRRSLCALVIPVLFLVAIPTIPNRRDPARDVSSATLAISAMMSPATQTPKSQRVRDRDQTLVMTSLKSNQTLPATRWIEARRRWHHQHSTAPVRPRIRSQVTGLALWASRTRSSLCHQVKCRACQVMRSAGISTNVSPLYNPVDSRVCNCLGADLCW